ncbi:MAG: hypothetical protein JW384_01835 [Nitrosomonadaceae bacterium]|nr:hypothetical protein [Nitrosomonadaceae bacterium]
MHMTPWTAAEKKILSRLSTPAKIQDFVNTLKYRVQGNNEISHSPRRVLRERQSQCFEGAVFAAAALRFHGFKPLILDLESVEHDWDHVVAVFKIDHCWGAISKTNHGVLRYREPVYRTIRELTMSYFHEYFLQDSRVKTLRAYSQPVDLARFDKQSWETTNENIFFIALHLSAVPHTPILTRSQIRKLRPADPIEAKMTSFTEWPE